MPKVLVIKNISREGPGMLADLMRQRGIAYDTVDLHRGEEFPDPLKYDALIVMGGPDSANDATDKMKNEILQVRRAISSGMPYLGVCLGMQVLVKAAGGTVLKSEAPEIGCRGPDGAFFEIALNEEGRNDPLFAGLQPRLRIFQLHGETVELTDSMKNLASSKLCANQVVRVGKNAYGTQGHFELTEEMLRTWAEEDPDLQRLPSESLVSDYKEAKAEYEKTFTGIFTNFLKATGLA